MVRLTLEYASSLCDPYMVEDINRLERVQRRAARFVHNNYRDRQPGCVSKMVQDLNCEPLSSRRRNKRLVMLYKIQRGFLVDMNATQIRSSDRRTRGTNILYQPTATGRVYSNSFYSRIIQDWNRLPTSVTDEPSIKEFRAALGCVDAVPSSH